MQITHRHTGAETGMNDHAHGVSRVLTVLLVLLLLIGLGTALHYGVDQLLRWCANLDPTLGLVLLVCTTIYLSVRTVARSLVAARTLEHEAYRQRHRAEIYQRLLRAYLASAPAERDRDLTNIERDLLLWGSGDVIRTYLDVRRVDPQSPEFAMALAEWLQALRADIGATHGPRDNNGLAELAVGSAERSLPNQVTR
jgi:hypothetical protein